MSKKIVAIFFAVLAAVLYAVNIPFSKILLKSVQPAMMAAYLYLGAGLGIGILSLFGKNKNKTDNEKFSKKDLPFVFLMVVLDIAAPILLMLGVKSSSPSSASLLNNFEIVCTSLIALLLFKEVISKKTWLAIVLIAISSFVLSFSDISAFKLSWGAVLVLMATLCWGFENNCTRKLANKNTFKVVIIKGIFSGLGALIVAVIAGERFSDITSFLLALLLGFFAYGLSIYFYVKAQGVIGAAKTSAYYSVAPFIGAFLSFLIFKESLSEIYFIGLIIMIVGAGIVVYDTINQKNE